MMFKDEGIDLGKRQRYIGTLKTYERETVWSSISTLMIGPR